MAVLSFIFLGKSFSLVSYAVMLPTVAVCVLISLGDPLRSFSEMKSQLALLAALASAFIYSVREVFFQHVSSSSEK
jgi:drug/metabolite transporter (DMT)-like permease